MSPDFLFESMSPYHPVCSHSRGGIYAENAPRFGRRSKELLAIQQEFGRLEKRIDAVRDCVTGSLIRIFGEERPAFTGLAEQQLIEKIAGRVAAQLGTVPKPQAKGEQRYIRDVEAAKYLRVSAATLRSWRAKRSPSGPAVTRIDRMVMYSMKGLEQFMELRTVEGGGNRDGTERGYCERHFCSAGLSGSRANPVERNITGEVYTRSRKASGYERYGHLHCHSGQKPNIVSVQLG